MMRNAFSALVIVLATLLLQWHGVQFWRDLVGEFWIGFAWSVVLEIVVLWAWFYGRFFMLCFFASCLLLAGPLFHVVSPIVADYQRVLFADSLRVKHEALINADLDMYQQSLDQALANSDERTGWQSEIQSLRDLIAVKRSELHDSYRSEARVLAIGVWIKCSLQAVALLVIWIVSVCAIRSLSGAVASLDNNSSMIIDVDANDGLVHSSVESEPVLVHRVSNAIDLEIAKSAKSQNLWADEVGIKRKDVSTIRNHDRLIAKNKQTISDRKLNEIATILGVN